MKRGYLYYIAALIWGIPGVTISVKGIKAYLNHLMKTRDGERLGSASTAEYDFADVPVVADDDDNLF
jgi:hypothetical protein